MATEIVHWCDWHIADENTTRVIAVASHAVAIDGAEMTLDLCEECEVKRWQPFASFASTFGTTVKPVKPGKRKPDDALDEVERRREVKRAADRARRAEIEASKPGAGSTDCPRCDFEAISRTGLAAHAWAVHGIRGLDRVFDPTVPIGADGQRDESVEAH